MFLYILIFARFVSLGARPQMTQVNQLVSPGARPQMRHNCYNTKMSDEIVKKPKILFVDDEQNILDSFKRIFRGNKYNIITANSGQEGLDILHGTIVDLVVSDMQMPKMDGAEFLEQVAQKYPYTVRILLTGFSKIDSAIKAINKGKIYSYQTKPWDNEAFKVHIEKALEFKRINDERIELQELTKKQNKELKYLNENLENLVDQRTSELKLAIEKLKLSYGDMIEILANFTEVRDITCESNYRQIAKIAKKAAKEFNFNEVKTKELYYAALLSDIGMFGLPDRIINTPYYELNLDDKKLIHKAPTIAEYILSNVAPLKNVAKIIKQTRERVDGNGYPDHITDDEISIEAKIISIIVDFFKLQNGRIVKEKLNARDAIDYIEKALDKNYSKEIFHKIKHLLLENAVKDKSILSRKLSLSSLKPGMIIANNVISESGYVLISKDHVLTENNISKLCELEKYLDKPLMVEIFK